MKTLTQRLGGLVLGLGVIAGNSDYANNSVYGRDIAVISEKSADSVFDESASYEKHDKIWINQRFALAELEKISPLYIGRDKGFPNHYSVTRLDKQTRKWDVKRKLIPGRQEREKQRLENPVKKGLITEGYEYQSGKTGVNSVFQFIISGIDNFSKNHKNYKDK